MLRTLLIATALLTASGSALARDGHGHGYGHVVSVEPHFSISFGTRHHDGFRVVYESGGGYYSTYTTYRPHHTIVLPPRHQVHHVYHYRDDGYGGYKHHKHKHKHKKYRDDWDDDDDHRGKHRGHHKHRGHDRD